MKTKNNYILCTCCIHDSGKGCLRGIHKGLSFDYGSKKGRHDYCKETVSKEMPELLQQRREYAREQRELRKS